MPRRNFLWILAIGFGSLVCWTLAQGGLVPPRGPLQFVKGFPGSNEDFERLNLLVSVLEHVELNYVHELTDDDRRRFIENAIQGGLQSLDLHSGYIPPHEYKIFMQQSDGSFGGIGIQITVSPQTRRLTVVSPIVGTPAYRAGIKAGDQIVKINGEPTEGMTVTDAVDRIQGPPGTKVVLTIRHHGTGTTEEVTITRSIIEIESVLGDRRDANKNWDFMLDKENRIGYVRLVQFGRRAPQELKTAIEQLKRQGVRALVLDLRGNPGGLLEAAVTIADYFLTRGVIVRVSGRNRPPQTFEAGYEDALLPNEPMVVLIDGSSASASEIVAAALQDHGRAVIVGERSFGKGSVQNLIPMENGRSALKLTTARYLRPSGKNIHRFTDSKEEDEWGVRPDIEVKLTIEQKRRYWTGRRDRDIVRDGRLSDDDERRVASAGPTLGVAWTMTHPAGGPAASTASFLAIAGVLPQPKPPYADPVLDRALQYLRDKLDGSVAQR